MKLAFHFAQGARHRLDTRAVLPRFQSSVPALGVSRASGGDQKSIIYSSVLAPFSPGLWPWHWTADPGSASGAAHGSFPPAAFILDFLVIHTPWQCHIQQALQGSLAVVHLAIWDAVWKKSVVFPHITHQEWELCVNSLKCGQGKQNGSN